MLGSATYLFLKILLSEPKDFNFLLWRFLIKRKTKTCISTGFFNLNRHPGWGRRVQSLLGHILNPKKGGGDLLRIHRQC